MHVHHVLERPSSTPPLSNQLMTHRSGISLHLQRSDICFVVDMSHATVVVVVGRRPYSRGDR